MTASLPAKTQHPIIPGDKDAIMLRDLPMAAYHGHKASFSKSDLVYCDKSPLKCHAKHFALDEKKQDKFELGTAAHAMILEGPEKYWSRTKVVPDEVLGKNGARSTKAYKEWAAANAQYTILLADQARGVEAIYKSVLKKETFRRYLTGGLPELSIFWRDEFEGLPLILKARPDYLPANQVVVDLKTTADLHRFSKVATDLKYHWSAWLTCRGLTQATGITHNKYFFAVVEVEPPHDCVILETMPEQFALAEYELMELLPRLAACYNQDIWPGMPDEVMALELKPWAFEKARHILDRAA